MDGTCVQALCNRQLSAAEHAFLARGFRKLHPVEDIEDYQT